MDVNNISSVPGMGRFRSPRVFFPLTSTQLFRVLYALLFVVVVSPDFAAAQPFAFGMSTHYPGAGHVQVFGTAVDTQGNIVITGYFDQTIDFGGGPLVSGGGKYNSFLAKFNPSGSHLWSRSFGTDVAVVYSQGLALDSSDNIFIGGAFSGTVNFGGGPMTSVETAPNTDAFVASYDAAGAHRWSRDLGPGYVRDVGTTVGGEVMVMGPYYENADVGGDPPSAGWVIVGALTANGNYRWASRWITTLSDYPSGGVLTIDDAGNTFAAVLQDHDAPDGFNTRARAIRIGTSGQQIWNIGVGLVGPSFYNFASDIALDGSGNVVMVGGQNGPLGTFSGIPCPSAYLLKISPAGSPIWSKYVAGTAGFQSVVLEADNDIVVQGQASSTIDLGGGPISGLFLARYASDETFVANTGIPNTGVAHSGHMAQDIWGNLVITGDFNGTITFGGTILSAAGTDLFLARANSLATPVVGHLPYATRLSAFPNPFNPQTSIRYEVATAGHVTLAIYDARGEPVKTLTDGERHPGSYATSWGGESETGKRVGSGIYFLRMESPGGARTMKLVLLR
jgi:hypothetical protein